MIVDGRRLTGDDAARERERVAAHRRSLQVSAVALQVANHWDNNMPLREQRALCELVYAADLSGRRWDSLSLDERATVLSAFRRAIEFGVECAHAVTVR